MEEFASPAHQIMRRIPSTFSNLSSLLDANKSWASAMTKKQPNYFLSLSQQQTPQLLWIGWYFCFN